MNIHPNTIKRIFGGIVAMATVGAAFKLITPDQAKAVADNSRPVLESVVTLTVFVGTVWHPKHKETKK